MVSPTWIFVEIAGGSPWLFATFWGLNPLAVTSQWTPWSLTTTLLPLENVPGPERKGSSSKHLSCLRSGMLHFRGINSWDLLVPSTHWHNHGGTSNSFLSANPSTQNSWVTKRFLGIEVFPCMIRNAILAFLDMRFSFKSLVKAQNVFKPRKKDLSNDTFFETASTPTVLSEIWTMATKIFYQSCIDVSDVFPPDQKTKKGQNQRLIFLFAIVENPKLVLWMDVDRLSMFDTNIRQPKQAGPTRYGRPLHIATLRRRRLFQSPSKQKPREKTQSPQGWYETHPEI